MIHFRQLRHFKQQINLITPGGLTFRVEGYCCLDELQAFGGALLRFVEFFLIRRFQELDAGAVFENCCGLVSWQLGYSKRAIPICAGQHRVRFRALISDDVLIEGALQDPLVPAFLVLHCAAEISNRLVCFFIGRIVKNDSFVRGYCLISFSDVGLTLVTRFVLRVNCPRNEEEGNFV